MLDDLTKEVKAQLYERVKSPLFGAFALSWVAWNYRALLAVLSKTPFKETLDYLESLYPSVWHSLGYCLAGPLLTAVAFLLVYPHPARWMYRYWANQHKELKKVQQQIEDETPMTQEEAKALRKTSLAQATEVQGQLRDMSQMNRELNERLKALTEENLRLASERDKFEQAALKAEEQLSSQRTELPTPTAARAKRIANIDATRTLYDSLPEDTKEALGEHFGSDQAVRNVFLLLVAGGGVGNADALSTHLRVNPMIVKQALSVLTRAHLVRKTDQGSCFLTDAGSTIAHDLNLPQVLPRVIL